VGIGKSSRRVEEFVGQITIIRAWKLCCEFWLKKNVISNDEIKSEGKHIDELGI
jgi:hypothetical protein